MKPRSINVSASAEFDIRTIVDWYLDQAGEDIALRFRNAVDQTFIVIADQPEMGSPIKSLNKALRNLRKRTIKGFASYRVFYIAQADVIEIVRIVHSSQDWWGEFDVDHTTD